MRHITIVDIVNKNFNEFLVITSSSNFNKILRIKGGMLIRIKIKYKIKLFRIKKFKIIDRARLMKINVVPVNRQIPSFFP